MSEENATRADLREMPPITGELRRFIRVFLRRKVVILGVPVILAFIITAIFAPVLAPYDPYQIDLQQSLAQPSWEHPFGTDILGRDTLSRLIYGSRTSLLICILSVGMACLGGITLGLIAGYFGGIVYTVIMRLVDALMSFPPILKALVIGAFLGGGLQNVVIALGIGFISIYARVTCGLVLSVKENDYVTAARVIGASNQRIMLHHVLKNCFSPLIVLITLMMGAAILAEAALSFLGVGIAAPGAAWGSMVSDGRRYLETNPMLSFAPGLAIMFVVLAFNMVGDGLRDALDPKLRSRI